MYAKKHIGNDVMYMRTSGAIWMFFEFFLAPKRKVPLISV